MGWLGVGGVALALLPAMSGADNRAGGRSGGGAALTQDAVVEQETQALAVVPDLLEFAQKAEDASCPALAVQATSIVARLYPEDTEMQALLQRRRSLPESAAEPPEDLSALRDRTYTAATRALLRWGDFAAANGGPALAQWVYGLAGEIGGIPNERNVEAAQAAMTAWEALRDGAKGDVTRERGYSRANAGGLTYVFRIPNNWSVDRTWPVLLVFHGTGTAWGARDDDEVGQLTKWRTPPGEGFVMVSMRDESMIGGQMPNEQAIVQGLDEALGRLMLQFRVDLRRVCLEAPASGALCCYAYFQHNPDRVAALEVSSGKFHGMQLPRGSAALEIPIRLGCLMGQHPNAPPGTPRHPQADAFDQMHKDQTESARAAFQRLGCTRLEWMGERFLGQDLPWFKAAVAERTPRYVEARGSRRRPPR